MAVGGGGDPHGAGARAEVQGLRGFIHEVIKGA
jgi:hypothetical protein